MAEVKLKTHQMNEKRKDLRVERSVHSIMSLPVCALDGRTWPFFVQHTLFHGEKDDFKAMDILNPSISKYSVLQSYMKKTEIVIQIYLVLCV